MTSSLLNPRSPAPQVKQNREASTEEEATAKSILALGCIKERWDRGDVEYLHGGGSEWHMGPAEEQAKMNGGKRVSRHVWFGEHMCSSGTVAAASDSVDLPRDGFDQNLMFVDELH